MDSGGVTHQDWRTGCPGSDIDRKANVMRSPHFPSIALLGGALSIATLVIAGPAGAGGNGATSQTGHARGTQTEGLVVLDFVPGNGAPPLPAGCWANPLLAIVSTDGHAVFHDTTNRAGDDWFTTTYAGGGAVYPVPQPPTFDSDGNVVVDTTNGPLYAGHLTTWFGQEDNHKNGVFHATVSFHGTSVADPTQAVSLNAHVQFATNANGTPTAQTAAAIC
jgi:hypothetical protein